MKSSEKAVLANGFPKYMYVYPLALKNSLNWNGEENINHPAFEQMAREEVIDQAARQLTRYWEQRGEYPKVQSGAIDWFTIHSMIGDHWIQSYRTTAASHAADQGNADAHYNLSHLYDEGRGVPKDHMEATRWLRKAANQGYAELERGSLP